MESHTPNFDDILKVTLEQYKQTFIENFRRDNSIFSYLQHSRPEPQPLSRRDIVKTWLRIRGERMRDAWGVLNGDYPEGDDW